MRSAQATGNRLFAIPRINEKITRTTVPEIQVDGRGLAFDPYEDVAGLNRPGGGAGDLGVPYRSFTFNDQGFRRDLLDKKKLTTSSIPPPTNPRARRRQERQAEKQMHQATRRLNKQNRRASRDQRHKDRLAAQDPNPTDTQVAPPTTGMQEAGILGGGDALGALKDIPPIFIVAGLALVGLIVYKTSH